MPTVLDSLVLELGLDPTKLNQQQKDAIESVRKLEQQWMRSGKVIDAQTQRTTESFAALKKQALGFVAVFLGGRGVKEFKEFTEYISQLDAATGRSARTMNISARELSNWQSVGEQTGGESRYTVAVLPCTGKRLVGPLRANSGHSPLWQPIPIQSRANVWIPGRKLPPSWDVPSAPSSAGKRNEDYRSTVSPVAAAVLCSLTATNSPTG